MGGRTAFPISNRTMSTRSLYDSFLGLESYYEHQRSRLEMSLKSLGYCLVFNQHAQDSSVITAELPAVASSDGRWYKAYWHFQVPTLFAIPSDPSLKSLSLDP